MKYLFLIILLSSCLSNDLSVLKRRSKETRSNFVLVHQDGKEVFRYDERKICIREYNKPDSKVLNCKKSNKPLKMELMSITKSIVSLGIMLLIQDEKLELETPLSIFYPKVDPRIKVKHLLSHTSGLQEDKGARKLFKASDSLVFSLESKVINEPGKKFFYNNRATNILPGIIKKASGKDISTFLGKRLFEPIGIIDWEWKKDPTGNFFGFAGLNITGEDLMKIGQVLLNEGRVNGEELLSPDLLKLFTEEPSQSLNRISTLLWWRHLGKNGRFLGYYGSGYLGQKLYINKRKKIIAIRQISYEDAFKGERQSETDFNDFIDVVESTFD